MMVDQQRPESEVELWRVRKADRKRDVLRFLCPLELTCGYLSLVFPSSGTFMVKFHRT